MEMLNKVFFFKQKTAYEIGTGDWSSDVCSSDLPEHAWLKESGRVEYTAVTDEQALEGFQLLCRTEGIIPALEPKNGRASWRERV